MQVPAGTVGENESLEEAVLRELREEAGISSARVVQYLGEFPYEREDRDETHLRNVYQLESSQEMPDSWIHQVKSDDEDDQLQFEFYWLPLSVAKKSLAVDQGKYLRFRTK